MGFLSLANPKKIRCETSASLRESFAEIAVALELPGADSARHFEENRMKVLQWLKETGMSLSPLAMVHSVLCNWAVGRQQSCWSACFSVHLGGAELALSRLSALAVDCCFLSMCARMQSFVVF